MKAISNNGKSHMPSTKRAETPVLTKREQQVADGIAAGLSNKEIAEQLNISYETVKEYVAYVLEKYDVSRRKLVAIQVLREQLTADVLGPELRRRSISKRLRSNA